MSTTKKTSCKTTAETIAIDAKTAKILAKNSKISGIPAAELAAKIIQAWGSGEIYFL